MLSTADTIAAIASAAGSAARGIVRISGPDTLAILERCVELPPKGNPVVLESTKPVILKRTLRVPCLPGQPQSLPVDLWVWPNRASFTRQPSAEIHTFGSPPLLDAVLEELCANGARIAEPGEFTLRAFLAGRIDLAQAEAVLGVIDARDRRQLNVALEQLAGGLSGPLKELMDDLLNLLADLEAGLDFVEEDIRFISQDELQSRLADALLKTSNLLSQMGSRELEQPISRVVLVGRPNAGKSSLFNALAGQNAAIVSPQPGATRDYLLAKLDLDGLSVELVDTAGIFEAKPTDPLHCSAQSTAQAQHEQAILRILCVDSTKPFEDWELHEANIDNTLVALTKCDLERDLHKSQIDRAPLELVHTSSNTGRGLDKLKLAIRNRILNCTEGSETMAAAGIRTRDSLRLTTECLQRAHALASTTHADELIASEVRTAWTELGSILGTVYTDDLLDRIFSRFCIGK